MIETEVMDRIIRVPDEEDAVEELAEKLKSEGFVITNFNKGGVFYTLLRVSVHVGIQLKQLAVDLINSAFMRHCPDDWVEIRAADFSKYRKDGQKAEGFVTVYRSDTSETVKVARGHPFRTDTDAYGNYLRFYALEETLLPQGEEECKILVQAEDAGAAYNVPAGSINRSMVHIEGSRSVTNLEGWMTIAGQEQESIESLRNRCLISRAESAERNIDLKLKSIVDSVPGVYFSKLDSQHPRGQGTCDIIVADASGQATEQLLARVREAIEPFTGSYGDYLVKGAETKQVDVQIDIYIEKGVSTAGMDETAVMLISSMMDIQKRSELNTFYRDSIIGVLITGLPHYRRCSILEPAEDVIADTGTILIKGTVTANVYNIAV